MTDVKRTRSAYRTAAWQRQRIRVLERDGYRCRACGAPGRQIGGRAVMTVQHSPHVPERVWAARRPEEPYPDQLLYALCQPCHGRADGGRRYTWDGRPV